MNISTVVELLEARLICGDVNQEREFLYGFASDLMSDVLTLDSDNLILITGLTNTQVIRTAEMADIHCVVLVRGKKVSAEMINLAEENHITLIETPFSMFRTVSVLYEAGLKPVY
ncbi:DRTGG domain-containing protein [Natronoflexus pectinivorans]|uniref:DRTGG domain-containing protein n=1 Tax=Natronoflexus pectinivorans TaxID=682526 RepID=A0A4R2GLC5_9BACT|nr:DRTGG domain-containing protein [Natronoflexus pectinivorans]TCO09723.1 DRTGG domain-containing protein [Natronoflexus pectinivorans]